MRLIHYSATLLIILITSGCITKFTPEIDENQNLVVVEGLITDQPEVYRIKLSRSLPLGTKPTPRPLKGCTVTVSDNLGQIYNFTESKTVAGTYESNIATFRGVVGRKYTLHIKTNNATPTHYSYESVPVELKAVPPVDSLFYEKVTIKEESNLSGPEEGSQIYLNTHDPAGKCRFYRWEYVETWKFILPYPVTNQVCWITNNSTEIEIKNTSVLAEDRVTRFPIRFISNQTDRLSVRYSILVNQYSLSDAEYTYWEKMLNISQNVGGLYDITPASVIGNISCVENPGEQVLGYFSVSAKTSKRIYIQETFRGLINLYYDCPTDTVFGNAPIPGLNSYVWIIIDHQLPPPAYKVISDDRGCADCTVRGTLIKPAFWEDY